MDGIKLDNVQIPNALETFWHCRNIELNQVQIDKADYLFMHSENISINNYKHNGNYAFQYGKNIEIHHAYGGSMRFVCIFKKDYLSL